MNGHWHPAEHEEYFVSVSTAQLEAYDELLEAARGAVSKMDGWFRDAPETHALRIAIAKATGTNT